ncbi:MAG: exosortase system-associated protein, TIGR04073 family [Verrucomicrobiota bacterium]
MAKRFSILGAVVLLAMLVAGCSNAEKKFGRGVNNIYEPIRLAEMRRSIEDTSLSNPEDVNYHTGVVRGFNRTLARTGVGIYEIITFPFPPYDPVFTDYLTPNPRVPRQLQAGLDGKFRLRHGYRHRIQRG